MENCTEVPCNFDDKHYWGNDPPPMEDEHTTLDDGFMLVEELEKATGSGTGDMFPESQLVTIEALEASDSESEEKASAKSTIGELIKRDEEQQKTMRRQQQKSGSVQELVREMAGRISADEVPTRLGGPLTPKISKKRTGEDKTRKVHLIRQDEMAVGCGYKAHGYDIFTQADAQDMMEKRNLKDNARCMLCFKNFTWPKDWHLGDGTTYGSVSPKRTGPKQDEESATEDSDDSDSDSMVENDSLSEEEAFIPDLSKEKKTNRAEGGEIGAPHWSTPLDAEVSKERATGSPRSELTAVPVSVPRHTLA